MNPSVIYGGYLTIDPEGEREEELYCLMIPRHLEGIKYYSLNKGRSTPTHGCAPFSDNDEGYAHECVEQDFPDTEFIKVEDLESLVECHNKPRNIKVTMIRKEVCGAR